MGGLYHQRLLFAVRSTEREIEPPLDDVERAERVGVRGEAVEWGVEGEADVVDFLAEDRGDVAE